MLVHFMQEYHLDHLKIAIQHPLVYDEIQHIKNNHDALGTLLETNRLKIREPGEESTRAAIKAAKKQEIFHNYQNKMFQ